MSKASINTDINDYNIDVNKSLGEWQHSPLDDIAVCSNCNYEHYLGTYQQYATNYCPKCGKKMRAINIE